MTGTSVNPAENGVAAVVVAKWEGVFGSELQDESNGESAAA